MNEDNLPASVNCKDYYGCRGCPVIGKCEAFAEVYEGEGGGDD